MKGINNKLNTGILFKNIAGTLLCTDEFAIQSKSRSIRPVFLILFIFPKTVKIRYDEKKEANINTIFDKIFYSQYA
jgi:hypothetical protein